MRRRIARAAVAATILLNLLVAAGPTQAVVPGTNGQILFTRTICKPDTLPCWEIVVADANDTHETVVAGPYPRGVWDDHFIANWAPNGQSLIFMADLGQGQKIWQVNADGSNLHVLWSPPADGNGLDDGPAFTPDGKRIIFTRCCPKDSGYSLWRINADGTNLVKVTSEVVPPTVDGPSDNLPQVSPDGTMITYHRNVVTCKDEADCGNRIVTVNINGGNRVQLTDPALDAQIPNWSTDGTRIVFQAVGNVWAVNADGTGLTEITHDSGRSVSLNPSYSPDGTKIIFGHGPSTGGRDLFTMNPDGTDVTLIAHTSADERFPQWATAT